MKLWLKLIGNGVLNFTEPMVWIFLRRAFGSMGYCEKRIGESVVYCRRESIELIDTGLELIQETSGDDYLVLVQNRLTFVEDMRKFKYFYNDNMRFRIPDWHLERGKYGAAFSLILGIRFHEWHSAVSRRERYTDTPYGRAPVKSAVDWLDEHWGDAEVSKAYREFCNLEI